MSTKVLKAAEIAKKREDWKTYNGLMESYWNALMDDTTLATNGTEIKVSEATENYAERYITAYENE